MKTIVIVLMLATPLQAQSLEQPSTPASPRAQSFYRGMSWGTLGAEAGLATYEVFKADDKKKAGLKVGGAFLLTSLSTLAVKKWSPEDRPCAPNDCGSDNPHASRWSGHTANACALIPLRSGPYALIVGAALAALTAEGRILGNRHWPLDTVLGCADGMFNNWLMTRIK